MRTGAVAVLPALLRGVPCRVAPSRCRHQRGFTLVELIISAGLLGLLALTATFFWVNSFALVKSVNTDSAAIADGRALLERLAREIRETKYDAVNGTYCVSTMAASQMVFNKTSDTTASACGGANPVNNDIAVNIQLPANSANLNLGYAGVLAAPSGTRALTGYASAFAIRYLDGTYAVTASAVSLRFVELTLTLQPQGVQATQSRTVVALRN
jgi:prepilin-type N-terminal cleavage/methylation domain-containing protein